MELALSLLEFHPLSNPLLQLVQEGAWSPLYSPAPLSPRLSCHHP